MNSQCARCISCRRVIAVALIAFLPAAIGMASGRLLCAEEPKEAESGAHQRMGQKGVVGALVSHRETLHSGVARAHWTWNTPKYKESVEWRLYFDYDKGMSRVDRHVTNASVSNKGHRSIRVDTPVESLIYVPASNIIVRRPPGAAAVAYGEVFDVRTTGLAALISVKGNAATWPNFLAMLERDGRASLRTEADGTLCVTWSKTKGVETPDGKLLERFGHSFWVDTKRSFVPVRATFFSGASPDPSVDGSRISAIVETEWTEQQGIMVPRRCAWKAPLSKQNAELTFEWLSVNGPVDVKLFTPEGLGALKGTLIVNDRLGKDVIESTIGEEPPMAVRRQMRSGAQGNRRDP